VSSAHDMHPTVTSRCPNLATSNLQLVTSIASAPIYLCTTPKTSHLTMSDLSSSSKVNIGSTTTDIAWLPLRAFIKHSRDPINARVIPFGGAGELRIAATGNELDFDFVGADAPVLIKQGAVCLAASSSDNYLKLPHLGKFVANFDYPNFEVNFALWAITPTPELTKTIERGLDSETFKNFIATRPGFQTKHTGNFKSSKIQFENLMNEHRALDSVR